MNFKAGLKTTVALAALSIIAACAQPLEGSRSAVTAKKIDRVFGDTTRSDNAGIFREYDPDGKGFFLFRAYSELPFPDRFTQRAGENYESSLVLDVALDFEESKGFPLYRVGLRPRKIGLQEVRTWPGYVAITAMNVPGRQGRLVAQLPTNRSLDKNGFIWSEVTYCSECFELTRIASAADRKDGEAFDLIERAQAAAQQKSGGISGFEGMVRFVGFAEEGILRGEQASSMAPIASAEVALAKSSVGMIAPSREAYFEFAEEYANEPTPVNVMRATCGDYAPSNDPAVPEAWEKERMAGYVTCLARTLDGFDDDARTARISELREQEAGLAQAGGIGPQYRIRVLSFEGEKQAAHALMQSTRDRFANWQDRAEVEPMKIISAPVEPKPLPDRVKSDPAIFEEVEGMTPPTQGSKAEVGTIGLEKEATEPTPEALPISDKREASAVQEEVGEPLCAISFLCPDQK